MGLGRFIVTWLGALPNHECDKATDSLKPCNEVILMIDVPEAPCSMDIEDESALIKKSDPEAIVVFAQETALGEGQSPQ